MFRMLASVAGVAILMTSGAVVARPLPPLGTPLPPLGTPLPLLVQQDLYITARLDQPLRYHQRLFDANEVSFGMPEDFVPRAAVVKMALQDLRRADRPWLELPASASMAENRYRGWLTLLQSVRHEPRGVQVVALNQFINAQPYRPDTNNTDEWQEPWRFLTSVGDCEDYAITKYVSLRHLGVAPARLRIAIVRDTKRDQYHAVLALYLDDDILILDNRADPVVSDKKVAHLKPLYSFNENEIWFHWYDGEPAPTVFSPSLLRLTTARR